MARNVRCGQELARLAGTVVGSTADVRAGARGHVRAH